MKKTLRLIVCFLLLLTACDPIGKGTFKNNKTFTLETEVSPKEAGKIIVNPEELVYSIGTKTTLTPEANAHWVFQKWEGSETGTNVPLPITMDTNKKIKAVFIKKEYPLNILIKGDGTVTETIVTNPSGKEYPHNTTVKLMPIPKEGWVFEKWEGDLTGNETPKNILVDEQKNVTVVFKRKNYDLKLTIVGEGTIEEKIVQNPNNREYPFETIVELMAKPKDGWEFDSWSGDLTGKTNPSTLKIDNPKNVTATFKRKNYNLNIIINGEGAVEEKIITNPSSKEYPFQTVIQLTPIPKLGWAFEKWSEDLTGTDFPKNITIDKAKNVTANFKKALIYFDELGTCYCPDAKSGEKASVNGIEYEAVDNTLLRTRRDQNADLSKVCTSLVTNMQDLFRNSIINPAIGSWDVSNVTNMSRMFLYASEFNQPIINWKVDKVTAMNDMFAGSNFNQPINNWNVSNVINMEFMFAVTDFDQPLDKWNVSNVKNMFGMFTNAQNFNQSIGNWNVSNVTNMRDMFYRATRFNQPLENWDIRNVTNMNGMFAESGFNQPLEKWNVGKVQDMGGMFFRNSFNHPIANWNVSNVYDMSYMFASTSFNHPIGNWKVGNVVDMEQMFSNSVFNQDIGEWNVSKVYGMNRMFYNNRAFNQDLSKWCVSEFSSPPFNFNLGATNWTLPKPVWGTCPK